MEKLPNDLLKEDQSEDLSEDLRKIPNLSEDLRNAKKIKKEF